MDRNFGTGTSRLRMARLKFSLQMSPVRAFDVSTHTVIAARASLVPVCGSSNPVQPWKNAGTLP